MSAFAAQSVAGPMEGASEVRVWDRPDLGNDGVLLVAQPAPRTSVSRISEVTHTGMVEGRAGPHLGSRRTAEASYSFSEWFHSISAVQPKLHP